MNNILPIFYDHSSKRSILTYWKENEYQEGGAQSIVKIAKDNNLKEIFGVSNNFHTFSEARKNLKEIGISFRFGLQMIFCNDAKIHDELSIKSNHKIIIWMKNKESYKDLIKIFSSCYTDITNKYHIYRFDYKQLKNLWTDNLSIGIPFFDSFVHNNLLKFGSNIIPDLPCDPVIFREQNSGIPFEPLINSALDTYNKNKIFEEVNTKTIYYENKNDIKSYMVYRAIDNGGTFNKPELEDFCSNNFCWQDYKEIIS